jgi:adenylylsulfate kinase
MAGMLNRHNIVAVVSQITPYSKLRQEVRSLLEHFVEVYLDCPLETLINRDQSGLYKMALAGEIKNFTGLDDPFEPVHSAEIVCPTGAEGPEQSLERIVTWLELANLVPTVKDRDKREDSPYTQEEEKKVIARLKDLGYL